MTCKKYFLPYGTRRLNKILAAKHTSQAQGAVGQHQCSRRHRRPHTEEKQPYAQSCLCHVDLFGTEKRAHRQPVFCAHILHQQGASTHHRTRCGCHDYGFFCLRHPVYSGRRPLQTSQTDEKGATVYMYNGGFHHSKIMMVDDIFCTVGTANLNSRSLRYDYETNAFIFNKEITGELNEMFRNDIEHCTQLTPEFWKKRSPWKKFVGWFANLFTPFL